MVVTLPSMKLAIAILILVAIPGSCVYFDGRDREALSALCRSFQSGQRVDAVLDAARSHPDFKVRAYEPAKSEGDFFLLSPALTSRSKYSCHVYFSSGIVTRVSFFEH